MQKKLKYVPCPTASEPELTDCEKQINEFGTYEVQKTADTDNAFPAIAQGSAKQTKPTTAQKEQAYKNSRR